MNSIGMLPTMEVQVDGMEPVPAGSMVGQIIGGRYRLTKLLGEGGMGAVYKATHINITKEVAVKLLHPEISQNPEAVTRFKQEAQSASSIGHPNIIGIDDFFALEDSRVCLIMEFLKGEPLNDVMLKPGGLEPLQTIDIMLQVCDGLHAAHQKGIIHRDMKPENVFLADVHNRQIVKILDFGIAKVTGNEDNNLTKTGTVFGTPHYMSPEQALGHKVDVRADVYSVGVMLFEIYTGQVPYQAESFMGVLSQHITSPVPAPSSISPNRPVPPMMEQIILTAMAKEVDKRFNSMEAVGNSLRAFREEMLKAGGDPLKTGVTGKMPAMDQAALAAGGGMAPPPAATPQPHAATGPHQGASGVEVDMSSAGPAPTQAPAMSGGDIPKTMMAAPGQSPAPSQGSLGPVVSAQQTPVPSHPSPTPVPVVPSPDPLSQPKKPKKSNTGLIIGIVAGVLVLGGGGVAAAILLSGDKDDKPKVASNETDKKKSGTAENTGDNTGKTGDKTADNTGDKTADNTGDKTADNTGDKTDQTPATKPITPATRTATRQLRPR
jgi:tRNA A-37 threonylcarbamoyl transferase component Bud32